MSDSRAEREAEIRALLPLVKKMAKRLKCLVPSLDLDDLAGDGCVGLIRAVDSFDPARGPVLESYARRLILGAMLNGIRRMDPVSERVRRTVRAGERQRYAAAARCGEVPTPAEMERLCPGYARALAAVHQGQPLSLDAPLPPGASFQGDWNDDPACILAQRTRREELVTLIERLPARQRDVMMLHYFGERSLRSIGRRLAISPQRTSQLHLSAIARLKRTIDDYAASP